MGVNHILSKMKNFLLIGVLCGAALASDYQYLEEVSSSSSKYDANEYITSYEVDGDKYSSHRPDYRPHQSHHSTAYRPHYQPQRTAYRYEAEPQYYSQPQHQPQYYQPQRTAYRYEEYQPQYYPQPHYDSRYARGYKTDVPVYGELYQPKPVSAPIIHRPKPFYLPKPKIVVAPHKPAKYDHKPAKYEHSETVYGPVDYYGRTGYNSQPEYYSQPQYYTPQPEYYSQPHYSRYARGYKTDVPVYGELYQPKPVSAPIIKRTKPFYLPKPKIVVAPHKAKGYY